MDTGSLPSQNPLPTRVPWAAVTVYAALACALAWLAVLPLWLGDGLESPLFLLLLPVMMYTPAIAALFVVFVMVRPTRRARYLGLVPFRPVGRKIALFLLWPAFWLVTGFGAFLLAVWFGWTTPDWSLSAISSMLPPGASTEVYLGISFAALPLNTIIATLAAFGEELGWRGFLTTALAPLGFWPTALITGVLWGVWHAPIIMLGYNYLRPDWTGVAWMCGFTLFVGVLLQWSRYWTGNVWPAAVGHGALNAATPLTLLWITPDADPAVATALGVPGWIAMGIAILLLFTAGVLGRRGARLTAGPEARRS
ncbi:CPBP family intramembrane metalloprotease [Leucobacter sp. CSA1]|uniref:CPBP family intramembrane metalloprotease n=1 Tax=Leucobacter chromiisoli TaxID=2796471 RepID=A0A934UVR0_9MICO|nr:CPBP family intramembrane glutamic endopeptidase [Leucobacter chromiisoli]MBK0419751.1 CPBP family intramembrane metalloprotease [Leucobacter chromiisoli]